MKPDMISALADKLIALNNASPHLPRKEQIEDILKAGIVANPAASSRADFAPKITMRVDDVTGNLIVSGKAADVELAYAVTRHTIHSSSSVVSAISIYTAIADMHAKLEESIWQALHCQHSSWVTSQLGGPDICMNCGRAKP